MARVSRRAFGKINLGLRVLGKREDGYHEISTVMAAVEMHDVLHFDLRNEGLVVTCPGLPDLPQERNLVTRAARLFLGDAGRPGLAVTVEKNIPPGAGMGGGSSDAALTLIILNEILAPEERRDMASLLRAASRIGADVPFFIGCNSVPPMWETALCTGIGEAVNPLPVRFSPVSREMLEESHPSVTDSRDVWLALAFPLFEVSTALAYRDWDDGRGYGAGEDAESALLEAFAAGDTAEVALRLYNDLEEPVSRRYPSIRRIKEEFCRCGALGASMTGSGSAVFAICGSKEDAVAVKSGMDRKKSELGIRATVVTRMGCWS